MILCILWGLLKNTGLMKTIVTFAAFIFIFLLIAPAQEETLIKNNNKRTQRDQPQEIIYQPLEDPVPIHDLYDGGGGYSPYFYYGDPSGMYFSEAWEDGSAGLIDGDDDHSNDQLYKLEEYYTRRGEEVGERMYLSKKSVLSQLKNHRGQVSDFLKSEKLKLKERDDLVKLFAYYNTLD